jgi:hypothetical protein
MDLDKCEPNHWAVILSGLGLLHLIFEYWLGKTTKTKANSTLELVIIAAAIVVAFLWKVKK